MTIEDVKRQKLIRAARVSVYSNSFLVISKLTVGLIISSISVISEAIHSATDLLAAIIAKYSVGKSTKPPDGTHKFGHGKFESFSSAVEALLILLAAGIIIYGSITRLISPLEIEIIEAGIAVMAFGAILNFFVSRYLMRVAKEYESLALEADALHLRTDVWTSIGVLIGLVAVRITGIYQLDPVIAILIAGLIIFAAVRLSRRSAYELLDRSLSHEEEMLVNSCIWRIAGDMVSYHQLRTRRAGRERFIDFHLVVPKNLPVERAHSICDEIEKALSGILPGANTAIHVEPCDGECESCKTAEKCKDDAS